MKAERIRKKATAYAEAWRSRFGAEPSTHNIELALSVAIHETQAGDAWRGPDGILDTEDDEHNWGATTLRALNQDERLILAATARQLLANAGLADRGDRIEFPSNRYVWINDSGKTLPLLPEEIEAVKPITPTVGKGHEERAKLAMKALRESEISLPAATIHCDSAPAIGPYFVWFAAFPTDVDGAAYFIRLLCLRKDGSFKAAKAILESAGGTAHDLAAAMYAVGYYTGFNDPKQPGGAQKNIDAYAKGINGVLPSVRAALV